MLDRLISWWFPVHRAKTEAERRALFRLRYRIYIEELGKRHVSGVDHGRGEVHDPEDDREDSMIFYTGPPEVPTGTMRADLYLPGKVPESFRARYSLDRFPELEVEPLSECTRLVLDFGVRGSMLALSMGISCYRYSAVERGARFGFSYAAPGLINRYAKFGMRPYAGRLLQTADGLRVPLIAVCSDTEFLHQVRSPLRFLVADAFGPGRHPPVDMVRFRDRIGDHVAPFKVNFRTVLRAIEPLFEAGQPLTEGVPRRAARLLARYGMLVMPKAGDLLLRRGLVDRELYVILEGEMEISRRGRIIARLGPGEPLGELALFTTPGRRTADVRALTPARLLVLRRLFVERLLNEDSKVGARFMVNIARIMASRMVGAMNQLESMEGGE
ncbi:MAG: cyclic nucleotide-binding domain-containing protein [Gammaproteobacteria bacterium]|nr:cyclic nucleotide-binding domain-containing protein [Gammaproteobacteria bacterium]